ncbi:MAG: hypothetical protein K0Q95_2600 [Bacteroidota bacterium]|jgi:hypothetical protein|nr:hypothetical protein [Bacteroidota bacterium]
MKHLVLTPFLLLCLFALQSKAQTSLPSGKTNPENIQVISVSEPKVEHKSVSSVRDDEKLAISMLNTPEVPHDFPRMQPDMSPVTYEKLVYEWFLRNPEKRKETSASPQ